MDGLKNVIIGIGEDVKVFVQEKPLATAGIGAGVLGAVALGVVAVRRKKAKKKRKKITHTKRGWKLDRAKKSKQKWEVAYRKRKAKLKKRSKRTTKKRVGKIYKTKKGQPYKILANGRARFIKKKKGGKR